MNAPDESSDVGIIAAWVVAIGFLLTCAGLAYEPLFFPGICVMLAGNALSLAGEGMKRRRK